MDGLMDGGMEGWINGWRDGLMGGREGGIYYKNQIYVPNNIHANDYKQHCCNSHFWRVPNLNSSSLAIFQPYEGVIVMSSKISTSSDFNENAYGY